MSLRKRDRDSSNGVRDGTEGDSSNDMCSEGPHEIDLLQQQHQPLAKRPRRKSSSRLDKTTTSMLSSSTEAGAEEGRGNVDTRQPVDASSTSGSSAVPKDVLHPNQNANENQESHGSALILSAAMAEEVTVSRDDLNEMQESCPVKEADGAAQDISVAPGPAMEEVLNQNQNRNQEELHDLSEEPLPEVEGAEQLPPLEIDGHHQNQHTRSPSAQAAKEKSEELSDRIQIIQIVQIASSGEKRGSEEGSGQAAQNVRNPNPGEAIEGGGELDEFAAFNQKLGESQLEPPEHVSMARVCHHDRAMAMEEELEPTEVCHDGMEILPRKIFAQADGRMSRLSGGWQIKPNVNHGPVTRTGPQDEDGYLGLIDRDGLMHILGFLPTPDLARFRASFTGARDVVSSHAALEIMERFPMVRVGVREPALSDMSQRRLAFADPAAGVSSSHYGGVRVLDRPTPSHALQAMVTSNENIRRTSVSVHGARFSRRLAANTRGGFVGVGVTGNGGGSFMARLEHCNKGIGLVKCEGRALESAFPSLHYLEEFGDLLMSQQKTLPSLEIFETQRRNLGFAPNEFITPRIRLEHVDRMVEVALRFKLSTVALHAAVCALDVCLGKIAVPGNRLKMLASVCMMIQSQESESTRSMTTSDVIVICARQFNASQVHSTYNIVVSNTQEATSRTVPATAAEILNRLLVGIGEVSGLTRPMGKSWDKKDVPVKEENILAILFVDLAMLDDYMFRFRPSTLTAAALFFASVTAVYYSKEECRLLMEVLGREYRPFIPLNPDLERRPFRDPSLSHFMASQPREAGAVRMCTERLWLLHKDFMNQLSNNNPSPLCGPALEGIKNKFSASGPMRLQAYKNLGLVPKPLLESMLDKHLPPHDPVSFYKAASTSRASSSSAGRSSKN